jgi:hypothetical protein
MTSSFPMATQQKRHNPNGKHCPSGAIAPKPKITCYIFKYIPVQFVLFFKFAKQALISKCTLEKLGQQQKLDRAVGVRVALRKCHNQGYK